MNELAHARERDRMNEYLHSIYARDMNVFDTVACVYVYIYIYLSYDPHHSTYTFHHKFNDIWYGRLMHATGK